MSEHAAVPPVRILALVERWAAQDPHRIALLDTSRQFTYARLAAASASAARMFAARGVRAGDRVMILAENTVASVVLMLGAQRLDAWPAIVNARIPGREIAALRTCADARIVTYAISDSTATAKHAEEDAIRDIEETAFGRIGFAAPNPDSAMEPSFPEPERQVALMIFTSGTTGTPKAVMLSHHGLLNLGAVLSKTRHTTATDRYSGAGPLSHIMGVANLMNILWAGASLELMPRLELPALAKAIASGRMTHLSFVPTVYARLLDYADRHAIDFSGNRLHYISSGGAPLDPVLKRRIEATFGMPMVNGYGMTECAPAARSRNDRYSDEPNCIGRPEPGVEARIVDRDGHDVANDGVGELWLRSPSVMMGYYRNPEATAQALRPGGWLATGDLARWLPESEIAIVGRAKEMIIRSGFNVYPAEVEAAINSLPGVLHCGVVGRKVEEGNEEVIAFVEPRPGVRLVEEQIIDGLRDLIAPYKRPQHVVVLDALPIGATGKIWKSRLSELAETLD